ncbi:MOSC domain-containing protein [Marinobacter halophilus]|uniref:MOSC domain-containing protein n=2 Tax=Marinobacter halophilus TaxID=1323740 RepID=A0A2T1KH05_9GAMM|nr:MOSC N-terminal beta barrel domain-containing protein [Marinobacter halophilus]PSF09416.1 MOSC domain-containing protein [Marinobacter halophilus]GGC78076.1 molybdenum cofactor sulfurase [Marinobacter halophilus]
MRVHSLFLYPVKSLAGVEVSVIDLDDFGPVGDRRWMLVNDQGEFVTQRKLPALARIGTGIDERGVSVHIPGEGRFHLAPGHEELSVLVWRDWMNSLIGPKQASAAVSRFCERSLRFVYMPDDTFRRVDPARVVDQKRVGFADGFPFLFANQASLDELNSRLKHPVNMRHFRPNIVISGAEPWSEDHWQYLTIGQARFKAVKPCSRCVITTMDPDTGTKDPGTEPLRTLSTYRKTQDGVIFGQNAVHQDGDHLSVGDAVIICPQES